MLKPLRDLVIVRPTARKLSDVIFVNNQEPFNEGTIIAIGPDVLEAKPGDFIKYGNGTYLDWPVFHIDGQDLQLIQEGDVACVLENE